MEPGWSSRGCRGTRDQSSGSRHREGEGWVRPRGGHGHRQRDTGLTRKTEICAGTGESCRVQGEGSGHGVWALVGRKPGLTGQHISVAVLGLVLQGRGRCLRLALALLAQSLWESRAVCVGFLHGPKYALCSTHRDTWLLLQRAAEGTGACCGCQASRAGRPHRQTTALGNQSKRGAVLDRKEG